MIATLIAHEWRRAIRTRRIWIVLAFCLFSAALDPITTKFLPSLLENVRGLEIANLPGQTGIDALKAYASDSSRLAMLAFVLSFMGMATDEFKRDSAAGAFVFTRKVSHSNLVSAKLVIAFVSGWGAFLVGYCLAAVISFALFGAVPWSAFFASIPLTGLFWLVASALLIGGGAAFRSGILAVATAYGAIFLLSIFELFGFLAAWSPTSLGTSIAPLASGEPITGFWRSGLVGAACAGIMLLWGLARRPN